MSTSPNDATDTPAFEAPGFETPIGQAGSKLLGTIKTVVQAAGVLRGLGIVNAIAKRGEVVERALATVGIRKPKGSLGSLAVFGAGVLVGASAGVLFAPMSGSELRRTLKGYFRGAHAPKDGASPEATNGVAHTPEA